MSLKRISSNPDFISVLAHRARLAAYAVAAVLSLAFLGSGAPAFGAGLTGRIVYVCSAPDSGKICIYDLSAASNLNTGVSGVNPRFSPDGSMIAFSGIKVMNSNGTSLRSVTTFGGTPAWSPDGLKLAFGAQGSSGIWVVNLDGSGLTQLTNYGMKPAWAPDGSQIAFSSSKDSPDSEIWLMNANGTNARVALTKPGEDIDTIWRPSWLIVFAGFVDRQSGGYEIFAFNLNTSTLTRLTTRPKNDFEPTWSPDGTRIAFASPGAKPAGIYVMNADGSSPQLVIAGGRQPGWGP